MNLLDVLHGCLDPSSCGAGGIFPGVEGAGKDPPMHRKKWRMEKKVWRMGREENGWEGEEGDVGEGEGGGKGGEEWRDGWGREWVGEKVSWRVWSKVEYIVCEV